MILCSVKIIKKLKNEDSAQELEFISPLATLPYLCCPLLTDKTFKPLNYENTHIDIVEGCRKGDRRSQFELYKLYSKAMYNVCLRMVKNEVDAEDLLQNSFVDIFKRIHTFRGEASVGAWMKRVVINNCINFLKKRRLHFQELEERHAQTAVETEVAKSKVNVKAINEAIMQLSDGYRVVFSLYAMEGYDHKEIAQILNVTEATSKSQYSRAKQRLRVLLEADNAKQLRL